MKVTIIKYSRSYQPAPYEKEEYALEASLDESGKENAIDCLSELKSMVAAAHTDKAMKGEETVNFEALPFEPEPIVGDINKVLEPSFEEDSHVAYSDVAEFKDPGPLPFTKKRGRKPKAEKEVEAPVEEKPKRKFKSKGQTYSRANDLHKQMFTNILNTVNPAWRVDSDLKKLAKETSLAAEGKEFLDNDGQVIPSFQKFVEQSFEN